MTAKGMLKLLGCLAAVAPSIAHAQSTNSLAPAPAVAPVDTTSYRIGPGDTLDIFVWKNADLSTSVPVRPDGQITTPLVQDTQAQGRTPTELAAALRESLSRYIQDPVVTVIVKSFAAPSNVSAIRVVGAGAAPKVVPYRTGLTALDVLIEVGGLGTFANGNRAQLIRTVEGRYETHPLRLSDLLKGGKLSANTVLMPGDIIRIPQRGF